MNYLKDILIRVKSAFMEEWIFYLGIIIIIIGRHVLKSSSIDLFNILKEEWGLIAFLFAYLIFKVIHYDTNKK